MLPMKDHIASIRAIRDCMDDLGFVINDQPSFHAQATIRNPDNGQFGSITVTFKSNWGSGDGPYIEFTDVIRGYGIGYTYFQPQWQHFTYNKEAKQLKVVSDTYSFILTFAASTD